VLYALSNSIRETKNSDEFDDSAVSPPDGDAHFFYHVVGNSMVI
jgi:hypothetical protein